ncbi:hypothetical protein C8Q74DRAFT_1219579 [Fomes fomentarius]|nr:hypothetical protein C8Q74DRAFT_1219579 [Fomes fomentarius]
MNASFPEDIQQCQHAVISWSGGVPPYTLDIFTTHFTSTPSQSFPFINDTTFGWTTNLSVGTAVWFKLFDCAGNSAESMSSVNVAAGSTRCMQQWVSWPPTSSYGTSTSTPQPTTASESLATQGKLNSRTIGGIAAAGGVVLLGIVILGYYLSRAIRRRRITRAPQVDLNESPRFTGTPPTTWREPIQRPRPTVPSYASSAKLLSPQISRRSTRDYGGPSQESHFALNTFPADYGDVRDSGASDLEQLHRLHTTPFTGELLYRSLSLDAAEYTARSGRRGKRTRTRTLSEAVSAAGPHTVAEETIAEEVAPAGRGRRAVEEEALDEVPRGPRQESDGGVRLAGGPPDDLFGDTRHGQSDSPLPPPYHPY